jgi:hypothetical protein
MDLTVLQVVASCSLVEVHPLSEVLAASIVRAKRRKTSTRLHGATLQNTATFDVNIVHLTNKRIIRV